MNRITSVVPVLKHGCEYGGFLGMCKDYHWVQVERNYKLIQNQTTDRQEQTGTGRTLRTGKPAVKLDDRRRLWQIRNR